MIRTRPFELLDSMVRETVGKDGRKASLQREIV